MRRLGGLDGLMTQVITAKHERDRILKSYSRETLMPPSISPAVGERTKTPQDLLKLERARDKRERRRQRRLINGE